jgi:hypothetical protein
MILSDSRDSSFFGDRLDPSLQRPIKHSIGRAAAIPHFTSVAHFRSPFDCQMALAAGIHRTPDRCRAMIMEKKSNAPLGRTESRCAIAGR